MDRDSCLQKRVTRLRCLKLWLADFHPFLFGSAQQIFRSCERSAEIGQSIMHDCGLSQPRISRPMTVAAQRSRSGADQGIGGMLDFVVPVTGDAPGKSRSREY